MRTTRTTTLFLAAVIVAAGACRSATAPEERDLAQAKQRWALGGVRSYDFTVRRSCECAPDAVRPVTVSVVSGVVTRRVYADTGMPAPDDAQAFTTIEALFGIVDTALGRHAASVIAVYDPALGVPRQISIDTDAQMVDDEISYVVSAFTRR